MGEKSIRNVLPSAPMLWQPQRAPWEMSSLGCSYGSLGSDVQVVGGISSVSIPITEFMLLLGGEENHPESPTWITEAQNKRSCLCLPCRSACVCVCLSFRTVPERSVCTSSARWAVWKEARVPSFSSAPGWAWPPFSRWDSPSPPVPHTDPARQPLTRTGRLCGRSGGSGSAWSDLQGENQNRSYAVRSTGSFSVIEMPYRNLEIDFPSNSTVVSALPLAWNSAPCGPGMVPPLGDIFGRTRSSVSRWTQPWSGWRQTISSLSRVGSSPWLCWPASSCWLCWSSSCTRYVLYPRQPSGWWDNGNETASGGPSPSISLPPLAARLFQSRAPPPGWLRQGALAATGEWRREHGGLTTPPPFLPPRILLAHSWQKASHSGSAAYRISALPLSNTGRDSTVRGLKLKSLAKRNDSCEHSAMSTDQRDWYASQAKWSSKIKWTPSLPADCPVRTSGRDSCKASLRVWPRVLPPVGRLFFYFIGLLHCPLLVSSAHHNALMSFRLHQH